MCLRTPTMKTLVLLVLCVGVWGMALDRASEVPSEQLEPPTLLMRHLARATRHMDRGAGSQEYRESIEFLRAHSQEAVAEVSGFLLEEKGSFRKWQIAYLIGELGGGDALALLRRWVEQPLPAPKVVNDGQHWVDLSFTEEGAARAQAVSSIARIATLRPALRDQVISHLLSIAKGHPELEDASLFELRALLGEDFGSIRSRFGPDDARHFEPYAPAIEWQGLLQERKAKHLRQRRELARSQEAVCRAR